MESGVDREEADMRIQRIRIGKTSVLFGALMSVCSACGMMWCVSAVSVSLSLAEDMTKVSYMEFIRYNMLVEAGIYGLLCVLFLVFFIKGLEMVWRFFLYRKLEKMIGGRELVSLEEMSAAFGGSAKRARKRLTKMIKCGYFPEGHLNREFTCFLTTDAAYADYQKVVDDWRMQEEKWRLEGMTEDKRNILDEARRCAERIGQSIDLMHEELFKQELLEMKMSVERLLSACGYYPENIYILRTFLNYYLPLAEKLLKEYEMLPDYDAGQNIGELKKDIPEGLRTLMKAFAQIGDRLCSQSEERITEDILLLDALMKQRQLEE